MTHWLHAVWAPTLPAMMAFSAVASRLTGLQDDWLAAISSGGFQVMDCNRYQGHDYAALCGSNPVGTTYVHGLSTAVNRNPQLYAPPSKDTHGKSCGDDDLWVQLCTNDIIRLRDVVAALPVLVCDANTQVLSRVEQLCEESFAHSSNALRDLSARFAGRCLTLLQMQQVLAEFTSRAAWAIYNTLTVENFASADEGGHQFRDVQFACHHSSDKRQIVPSLLAELKGESTEESHLAEIGVYHADTTVSWLSRMEKLSVIAVDPFQDVFSSGTQRQDEYGSSASEDLQIAHRHLRHFIDAGRAQLIVATSVAAASKIANRSLDLVFLDGDHSARAVEEDIRAWIPKVRPGGIMAGHDYSFFHCSGDECPAFPDRAGALAPWHSRSVAAAVHASKPAGVQLHLAPDAVWWWAVPE